MRNFKNVLYEILSNKLNVNTEDLEYEKLFSDLGANSLDMVELIIELENVLGISIPDEIADNVKTVGELESCILKLLKK